MYPSLLDVDSPFALGKGSSAGLSYVLVGNSSCYVYFVIRRTLIARVKVAWVPFHVGGSSPRRSLSRRPRPQVAPLNPRNCSAFDLRWSAQGMRL